MKRKIIFTLIVGLAFSILGGCESKETKLEIIRIGCFPNVTHSQALINISEKNFQNIIGDDIAVEWKYFNSGNPEIEAFFASELDMGFIGPIPAVNGNIKSNGDIVIIAGATNGGAVLVGRKGSGIASVTDLANKKVAVPSFGNTQDFMLRMMLKENGLLEVTSGGNVEIIPVKNPDLKSYFEQGNIDAAFVPEPWGSQLINDNTAEMILDVDKTWNNGNYPTTIIIARKDFVANNRELVKQFLKSHIEIIDTYNDNQKDLGNVINQEILNITGSKLDDKVLEMAIPRIVMDVDPITDAIRTLSIAMKDHDFIDTDIQDEKLYDFSILNEVLNEMGKPNVE